MNFEAAEREAAARAAQAAQERGGEEEEELEIHDDEDMEDVYHAYVPQKLEEGVAHPTAIVETTSLAAVPPPDPNYKHHLEVRHPSKQHGKQPQLLSFEMVPAEHTLPPLPPPPSPVFSPLFPHMRCASVIPCI